MVQIPIEIGRLLHQLWKELHVMVIYIVLLGKKIQPHLGFTNYLMSPFRFSSTPKEFLTELVYKRNTFNMLLLEQIS